MNKTAIKNFAIWARRKLISDITYRAGMLGITEKGIALPMPQSTKDLQFFDIGTKDYVEVSGAEIQQRNALLAAIRAKEKTSDYKTAFRNVVEEVAYTWFNRLVAVRFMEVNDYLPSRIRVLSSSNPNKLEPDFVTTPFETDLEFTPYEKDLVLQLKDRNNLDELFRMLFIRQCNRLNDILPGLFEKTSDYTELLLTISFTDKDGVIYHLTHDISEDDFNVEKEGQVEIIGWLYQYYNTEPKDEVFALLKKNVKITKERIPAATQLFTPDWIVRYMVENSLGRLWVEGHPNEELKATWKYYLEEAEQEPEVQVQLAKIREEYAKINPEDIKLIDPCMGSGHILVYAFDVLMQIYTSYGYTQRDAARSILQNNLYGIDIDTRAYQLAYFAVMMKARQYNRRIFNEGILPNLMAVRNPAPHSDSCLKQLGDMEQLGRRLIDDFRDAEEYGSILQLSYTKEELDALEERLNQIRENTDEGNLLVQLESDECVSTLAPLVRQARIMSQKYDVVVTNPPYMGAGGMGTKLSGYVKKHYPDSKSDLFAVFIERCMQMTAQNRFQAMITQDAWMALKSYESLRKRIILRDIITLISLGIGAFEDLNSKIVQSTSFVLRQSSMNEWSGVFDRLYVREGLSENPELKMQRLIDGTHRYYVSKNIFKIVPGTPIAYWLNKQALSAFKEGVLLSEIGSSRVGLQTSDNDRFLRLWFECDMEKTFMNCCTINDSIKSAKKWYPHNKGGLYRRWYGNNEYVINYKNAGFDLRHAEGAAIIPEDYVFRRAITYSRVTSGPTGFRMQSQNSIFDSAAVDIFSEKTDYLIGLLNSKVVKLYLSVFSPGMNTQPGDIAKIPVRINESKSWIIEKLVDDCIILSKADWDSFETSWDFMLHPMLPVYADDPDYAYRVEDFYHLWERRCEDRFNQLKANEEELNRIFIDIYGLQEELTPEVEDKDVTVRKADLSRDIRSLISYAVGCMFGRYSANGPVGLIYAGGEWDPDRYGAFTPDEDNCIPITDVEYFQDDIVGRFVEFIRLVYGNATLEENLDFIAAALGNKGKTARDTIRSYFLNDFYTDHLKIYQKRPIYWLFDSGKQNGFKALVYMHRWNADTVGNLRVEYLHRMQTVYEKEIVNCQDAMDNSLNNRENAAARKRKEKLVKQLKECKDYDAKVAHIALSRIDIDLDDGVKFNYRRVQTAADGRFCEILADSKDIMIKEDSPIWQGRKNT
ncbi:MAG: BREX-1 system adenine-specific DNA-methyltransferase PglX [Oscillospiraceae bacterium]|nr:BREX-1 system adenine-specific DNA-methyltransferase PglX [Oscillospiraceae bacterium]